MTDPVERAREFARRLAGAYGRELVAVALYGSAARGEYREGVSDLNLLVVLRRVDAALLRSGSALAREWAAAGNPPPLLMSEAEWRGSADVFPIEYGDIRDAHVLLHGSELFADVEVRWDELRLQTERQLKEKKIQLREHFLLAAGSPSDTGRLLRQSFPTFLTLFRAGLRLAGEPVPRDADAVISGFAARAGLDPEPWREVLRARGRADEFAPAPDGPLVAGYLDGVTRAADWLDQLARGGGPRGG